MFLSLVNNKILRRLQWRIGHKDRNDSGKERSHSSSLTHPALPSYLLLLLSQVFKQRAVDARAVREEKRQEKRILLRKEVNRVLYGNQCGGANARRVRARITSKCGPGFSIHSTCMSLIALTHLVAQELADRLKKEEALRIKHDARVRSDKDQEQRMRDELGR